jgi:hypothetical protein
VYGAGCSDEGLGFRVLSLWIGFWILANRFGGPGLPLALEGGSHSELELFRQRYPESDFQPHLFCRQANSPHC